MEGWRDGGVGKQKRMDSHARLTPAVRLTARLSLSDRPGSETRRGSETRTRAETGSHEEIHTELQWFLNGSLEGVVVLRRTVTY
ncbi:hypothetical protein EYF80_033357 [Liparis tanakae]|uniref:Uncharacterized protein n=1 Tax=Liparis tanakae TaxID=230148 RepID=A0A4Z2GS46_9TELE|nr:hypothetical protein EYF80_033357 [Liparis tanakae]